MSIAAHRDLSAGSLDRHILRLALPSTAENLIFATSGLIHAYFMGRVGDTALAAVAIATTLRIVLISPMMGLSVGGMALVARYIGAREPRQADRAVMQTILLLLGFTAPLSLLGLTLGHVFLQWMGAEGGLLTEASAYLRIIFAGLFFMEMLPTINGVIRGAGHPECTLRINIVHIIATLLVETVLVLGLGPFPALGVRAAGWASVLGSAAGVVAQLVTLCRGSAGVRLHRSDLWPDLPLMRRILRIALPTAAQRLSPNLAAALLVRLITSYGDQVLTAYSLVNQIGAFLQGPAMGISNAAAALVGQNLGAARPDRAERAGLRGAAIAGICTAVLFGMLALWPAGVLRLFGPNAVTLKLAIVTARFFVLAGLGTAVLTVMASALGGAGDALAPMVITIASLWCVQLPLCWALSRAAGWGPVGIWTGMALGALVSAAAMTGRFRRGRWKAIAV